MLLELRKVTRGVFATLILGAIAVAMVLFLIPRVGSQSGMAAYVAKVGDAEISPGDLARELDVALEQTRAQGRNVSREDAIDHNAHLQLLEAMISRTATYEHARSLGVDVSDAQIARYVREMPGLRNPITGRFDANVLDEILSRRHMTRANLLYDIRLQMTNDMFLESMVAGVRPPSSYGALAFAFNTEQRVISVAEAPVSVVERAPPPTEAQLQAFYQQNRQSLQTPEYRALTLVYARASDFAPRVTITDAQLHQEFDRRSAALTQPEKRSSTRIAAQTEAQANAIAQRLAHGENADTIAHSLGVQAIHGADEARTAVSDANVADAVFAMSPNSAPRVVRGRLSPFVVVQVQSVTPAVAPNFNAARDQIRQEMALDSARELVDAATNTFDEARGGGATPTDAAHRAGRSVVVIPAADPQGRDAAGQPIPALSGEHNELLALATRTPENEASDFTPIGDGDVVVAVDRITPPSVRPFAQVREQLAQALVARELNRRLQEFADTVTHEVEQGHPLAQVASAHHMRMAARSQPITREQAQHLPSQRLGGEIFAASEGGVVSDVVVTPTGGGVLVGVVEHIRRIDPAQAAQQVQELRTQAQQQIAQQFGEVIQAQIAADTHVTRNQDVLRRNFRGSQDANTEDTSQ